jgi:hypothetical protein
MEPNFFSCDRCNYVVHNVGEVDMMDVFGQVQRLSCCYRCRNEMVQCSHSECKTQIETKIIVNNIRDPNKCRVCMQFTCYKHRAKTSYRYPICDTCRLFSSTRSIKDPPRILYCPPPKKYSVLL